MTKPSAASQLKTKDDPTIWVVDDELWERMRPLLVVNKPRKKPGRPRSDDRAILNALIWLARTGAQWERLPRVFPPKSTVNDRLAEWVVHGNLASIWAVLLIEYDNRFGINWIWQAGDGCITKAPLGKKGALGQAEGFGPSPVDRRKLGTKRHLLTSGEGLPLSLVVSGANVNDLTMLAELLDGRVVAIPDTAVAEGLHLCLDKAYNYKPGREAAQERLYTLHIPRQLTEELPEGTVRHPARRWVVEVCHSWMNRFRRLLVRWEKTLRNYLGFAQLAICLIIYRKLRRRLRLSG